MRLGRWKCNRKMRINDNLNSTDLPGESLLGLNRFGNDSISYRHPVSQPNEVLIGIYQKVNTASYTIFIYASDKGKQ